jgi:hypothetical protein
VIYSRFGNEVEICGGDSFKGIATVKREDGKTEKVFVGFLKADGGIDEILAQINAANEEKET